MAVKKVSATPFIGIIQKNKYLRELDLQEATKMVFQALLQRLTEFEDAYLSGQYGSRYHKYRSVCSKRKFIINFSLGSVKEQKRCVEVLGAIFQEELQVNISHTTIKEFWQRLNKSLGYKYYSISGYPDPAITLDPICQLMGFKGFKNFVDATFKSNTFTILILPLEGDPVKSFDAERNLRIRYNDIVEAEQSTKLKDVSTNYADIDIVFSAEYVNASIDFAKAREIGKEHGVGMVIFGHLFLRDVGHEKIRLHYVLVENKFLTPNSEWKSELRQFKFYELCEGDIPKEVDFVVYWILGMRAYKLNNISEAIRIFLKLEQRFNVVNEEMLFRLALLYDLNGQAAQSERYYLKAIEVDGAHYNSFLHLGINYVLKQEFEKAKNCLLPIAGALEKVKTKNLLYKFARINFAIALGKVGEIDLAEKFLIQISHSRSNATLEFREVWAMAHMELAEIYQQYYLEKKDAGVLQNIKKHFICTIRWSNNIETHNSIKEFFIAYNFVEEAIQEIKQYHAERKDLINLYATQTLTQEM